MSIPLKLLTVNQVRTKYWNKDKKAGKKINYYCFQTYDGKDIDGNRPKISGNTKPNVFIPDGTLIHHNSKTGQKTIINDWLSQSKSGPYKRNDKSKGLNDFYYLRGYCRNGNKKEKKCLQICSGPLNALSEDCLDEVNCWVKK